MKRIKFVTRIKNGKVTIPTQFLDETLEGLDMLVTVEPIAVDLDEEKMTGEEAMFKLWKHKKTTDENRVDVAHLKDREAQIYDNNCYGYDEYLDNARQRLTTEEIKPYNASEIKKKPQYIKEIIIKRLDSPEYNISLNGYIDGHLILGQPVKDKHELKTALGELQYADNFKLTIRSAPLYEELTSIIYHFFTPKYKLVNTETKLDDFIDTYEKDVERETRLTKLGEVKTRLPKEVTDKIIESLKNGEKEAFKKLREKAQEKAVLRGELKPIYEDGKIRYEKNDSKDKKTGI